MSISIGRIFTSALGVACLSVAGRLYAADDTQVAETAYAVNCAQCHGAHREGRAGIPNLADDVWLWGGDAASIEQTIRHGIRTKDPQTHPGEMPGFKHNDAEFTDANIKDLLQQLNHLAGRKADPQAVERTKESWAWCVDCHGADGRGKKEVGAPSLVGTTWLYGGSAKVISQSIAEGRKGTCPAWQGKLDDKTIKALAKFLASASNQAQKK